MLDPFLRKVKEKALAPAARAIGVSISPLAVTVLAFSFGVGSAFFVSRGSYAAGLVLWLVNRVLDGLDGTLARAQKSQSDFGAYADIILDTVIYSAIPIAFVVAQPGIAVSIAALVLLATFYVNTASWMYLSAILESKGAGAKARGELTTVAMPSSLIEGTETVIFFSLFYVFPNHAFVLFVAMAALVAVNLVHRLWWAHNRL